MTRFAIDGERSGLVATARSTLHDVPARGSGLEGWIDASLPDGVLDTDHPATAHLELPMHRLTADNPLVNHEIARRLDIRRHPLALADVLRTGEPAGRRYRVDGELTLCGVRQPVDGWATVLLGTDGTLVVDGTLQLDIRRFGLRPPSMIGLRVRPEVEVRVRIVAAPSD